MKDLIAIVGLGAILPDAPDVPTFWQNLRAARYSISELPPDRWSAELFYDPDPKAPDKTYSKIGAWVRGFKFEPFKMGLAIPPKIQGAIDEAQQWAIVACYQALQDYGYPQRPLNHERVAVILGNAMAGEHHYLSTIRIHLPEYLQILKGIPAFQALSKDAQEALIEGMSRGVQTRFPEIWEDTMPGELANVIAGRVANLFNFLGPNFVTDAACASSLAALQAAVDGLRFGQFDAVLTGGVDRNMGPESFVKFSKIGALSPDGSRPYAQGANGFVMGEGAAVFLLKRLVDAERDGDKIYAVIRGIGASSDGKGKGITAPNPLGQQRAIERAWKNAGVSPATVGLIEGHGTSTAVGDVVEVATLNTVFGATDLRVGSVALGSVKSNIGHLKSAAGAAGLLKTVLALHARELPPSVNFEKPNPNIDFAHSPFYVNTQIRPWEVRPGEVRRAGVSAFGFGGTNFHVVLEEYRPGILEGERKVFPAAIPAREAPLPSVVASDAKQQDTSLKPYRGLFFIGASSVDELRRLLQERIRQTEQGEMPPSFCPAPHEVGQMERLVIDFSNREEFLARAHKAAHALETDSPSAWQALALQGVYRGSGRPGKVAFLFPGQGSQYVNMLRELRDIEPVVAETFREADETMTPILGRSLSECIFVDGDKVAIEQAELKLRDTTLTQPAILTVNVALFRLLQKYGVHPDLTIGHSLGEYGALVAAGVFAFSDALRVVSARGQEMTRVTLVDTGCMAAVSAPIEKVEAILKQIPGYVVIANLNSPLQCVIGGETPAVEAAIQAFLAAGFQATKIPVSHAFHTKIVAPASQPLRRFIEKMNLQPPKLPVIANVTGDVYPTDREEILDLLAQQVASPVQYVRGVQRLYELGARVFIEVGPKRVLSTLATDILKEKTDVVVFSTNHPRKGDVLSFHEALCRLYAAGVTGDFTTPAVSVSLTERALPSSHQENVSAVLQTGRLPITGSVVISGAGLGLPGRNRRVFEDDNILALLKGEMRIDALPEKARQQMLDRRPVRLVKSEAGAILQSIETLDQTIKLAGLRGEFDLTEEFGVPAERCKVLDISTQLAIAAGIEALRDAGIPLVMSYKRTSTNSYLPDRWKLPEALADETGVIFASAFPGLNRMAEEAENFYEDLFLRRQIDELRRMLALIPPQQEELKTAMEQRIVALESEIARLDYHLDRHYIFRVLAMGHSQFAEYIGARGPNTHVNAACASTTHALSIAEDWIRSGRARRVIVIAGDDVTNDTLLPWIGTSLMASGAATTEGELRMAALPFDRRRNGMIIGMGAAALVVESEDAVRERGMRAICELLATVTANSAYHGTRLHVEHVGQVMETLLQTAERRFGIQRAAIAPYTVFVSHETYTPARGGSASAEIYALRRVFGEHADRLIIANTKGYTGHSMGVGIEDVLATKALEYGLVPPVAHIHDGFEPDSALGNLNLSTGGKYPVQYSLRLGAGFGSQIAMALFRRIPGQGERIQRPQYQRWLAEISGYTEPELEIVKRTLRIRDQGVPPTQPIASRWEYGCGPTAWAASPEQTIMPSAVLPPSNSLQVFTAGEAASPAVESAAVESAVSQPVVRVDREEIKSFLLEAVSEKTGYPVEMLDLDLDLEADLGIDTVKQAELFAVVREHYGIPRREDLRLADYNTLAKVITFVEESLQGGEQVVSARVEESIRVDSAEKTPAPVVESAVSQPVAGVDREEIKSFLLEAVSEKTGYPVEMLDLDLDLEADLGIDTVKQAELFAVVREHYGIPRREDLRLADYNTLAKVITFVEESLQGASPLDTALPLSTAPEISPDTSAAPSLSLQAEKTGGQEEREPEQTEQPKAALPARGQGPVSPIRRRVPVPVLRPRLEVCLSSGIKLEAGERVLVVESGRKTADALVRKLQSRQVEVLRLNLLELERPLREQIRAWQAVQPIRGVYFLAGLRPEPSLQEMTLAEWQKGLEMSLYSLAEIMREMPEETFLVGATRLDGMHGYSTEGAQGVFGGAISGFVKALAWERSSALIKVLDFSADARPSEIASALIEETLSDPDAVEIGYRNGLRYAIAAQEISLPPDATFELKDGSVFLISGGSAGILPFILEDLVAATRGVFYLLTRSPLPPANDPDLVRLTGDRDGLKRDLFVRLSGDGKKATPLQVEQMLFALERAAATHRAIEKIIAQGGRVHLLTCDVTDADAVARAIEQVAEAEGRLDVFIHAAGIERSRKLESKPDEEFRQVVSVKADGFFNIYHALRSKNLLPRGMVFFSSLAGRFGNSGQTDYSAANDLLCKVASVLSHLHPEMKTIAIDWSAWGGAGMATRGGIPRLMQMAGIEMLPPTEAASCLRAELLRGGGEVVIAGSLGILLSPRREHAGLDLEKANTLLQTQKGIHSLSGEVTNFDVLSGLVFETELDPLQQPFLRDHALNSIPVFPGVMGIEGFSFVARQAAFLLTPAKTPWEVVRLEEIEFLTALKFYRNQPRRLIWRTFAQGQSDEMVVYVTLESSPRLKVKETAPVVHFRSKVYLRRGEMPARLLSTSAPAWNGQPILEADTIYKVYFHGPAFQVLGGVQHANGVVLGKLNTALPPFASQSHSWLTSPKLVELCLQTAGVWEIARQGVLALPHAINRLTFYKVPSEETELYAEVEPRQSEEGSLYFNARVVDSGGQICLELEGYRTVPLPYKPPVDSLAPFKKALD